MVENRSQVLQHSIENCSIEYVTKQTISSHTQTFSLSIEYLSTYFIASIGWGKSYLNATEEETIEFGTLKVGIEKYPESFEYQWFLFVPEGRQVQIDFDTFELEQSDKCKDDYIEAREASISSSNPQQFVGIYGPILVEPRCTNPGTVQSKGNMVWVHFKSDSNSTTIYKGFKASFKAGLCLPVQSSKKYPLSYI